MSDGVYTGSTAGFTIASNIKPSLNIMGLVTIKPDGKIEYHEGYTPDAAAKALWESFGYRRALYEAAPDMLAALQRVELFLADIAPEAPNTGLRVAIRSAIQKATGSSTV